MSPENSIQKIETPGSRREKKVREVLQKIKVEYSPEEKKEFDVWKEHAKKSSVEVPLSLESAHELYELFPNVPNYERKAFGFFVDFKNKNKENEAHEFFSEFVKGKGKMYEATTTRLENDTWWFGVGNKTGSSSDVHEGWYFGHSHPSKLNNLIQKKDTLPELFEKCVMPSAGDLRGYLKEFLLKKEKEVTRIYSEFGWSDISILEKMNKKEIEENLNEYAETYFDLFLGENKMGFNSLKESQEYFRKKFGLSITFHEFPKEKCPE